MCKSLLKTSSDSTTKATTNDKQPFRVDSETYNFLLSNYSDQYSCYTQNVENNVCVCAPGNTDALCDTEYYTRCYINVTNPPFYRDCAKDHEDSFYYLYSIPGFSPCYPQYFNGTLEVEYTLNCKCIDEDGSICEE